MRERFPKAAHPSGSDAAHVREIGVSRSRDGLEAADRMPRGSAETAELTAETAGRQCAVQVAHRLPLDEHVCRSVVADRQVPVPNLGAETRQLVPNAARLVYVDLDANRLNPHAKIVPPKPSRMCAYRSREARTT